MARMNAWRFKLLYDGGCPLCRREARFLQRRNRHGRLAFEDITAPGFDPAVYHTTREELMGVIHGVFPDGRMVKKVEVFREAYRAIGLGWLLAPTGWPGLRWLTDRGYEWFARNRLPIGKWFGRKCDSETCAVPPANNYGWIIGAFIAVFVLTAGIELWMGRLPFGPDGKFGWWEGNIWSSENSQRFADPYSFSHLVHGILFYAGLWLVARKLPVRYRLLLALLLEASWEILENSPLIINRYREATISLGYTGDSVLNSLSDILMMTLGFLFASRVRPRMGVLAVLVMEIGCALCIRDNLTLNIIMLIHPVDAIKAWQMAGAPAG
jgi:predicted DCC family thiol-disulfide oxidoreductase YuxK